MHSLPDEFINVIIRLLTFDIFVTPYLLYRLWLRPLARARARLKGLKKSVLDLDVGHYDQLRRLELFVRVCKDSFLLYAVGDGDRHVAAHAIELLRTSLSHHKEAADE